MTRIKIICTAHGPASEHDNRWLVEYDPDGHGGAGLIVSTRAMSNAYVFENARKALEAWRAVSTIRPLRFDGKPNRPLTAWTVELR